MDFVLPEPEELKHGLRALVTVATVDGVLHDGERGVIDAAQKMLGGAYDLMDLEPITPEQLSKALPRELVRKQLFGGLIVMCMADGEINAGEAALIGRFADALGIEDGSVKNLERIAKGHFRRARLDILRRQWAVKKVREMAAEEGPGVIFRAMLGLLGVKDSPDIIAKYEAFREYPPESLGRAYYDYIIDNQFTFPGAKGSPPEAMLFHDLSHILSGYGTDPKGEIQVATFSAGYSSYEVYNWFMFVLSQFQLGLQTAPNVPPAQMEMNPLDLIVAYRRGAGMNIDINDGWDFWPVLDQPVDELRRRYSILPAEAYVPKG